MARKKRQIAPRLASGERRVSASISLPPDHKRAVMMIAYSQGISFSYAQEQLFTRIYKLPTPEYKEKANNGNGDDKKRGK